MLLKFPQISAMCHRLYRVQTVFHISVQRDDLFYAQSQVSWKTRCFVKADAKRSCAAKRLVCDPEGMFKRSRASAASQEHAELPFKEER